MFESFVKSIKKRMELDMKLTCDHSSSEVMGPKAVVDSATPRPDVDGLPRDEADCVSSLCPDDNVFVCKVSDVCG